MRFVLLIGVAALLAGCGAAKQASPPATATVAAPPETAARTTAPSGSPAPSPLQAEAKAAATGDIPDNQVFLRYVDARAGYSMKYPEGWAQQGSGPTVTIRDKNNIVRVVVKAGGTVTPAQARKDVGDVAGAAVAGTPTAMTVGGKHVVKVVYTTRSAANPVTGKRVQLVVDRYYLSHAGKLAVVDLGTPQGVDNVDAYRLMIESFTWR